MSIKKKKKYYDALFSASDVTDKSNLEKELVAFIATDLAIGEAFKTKKIKELKMDMIALPDNYYGTEDFSQEENEKFVEQAKLLVTNASKGISVNAGLYSTNIKREDSGVSTDYRIKIMSNGRNHLSEEEAEAQSISLSKNLEKYSKVKIIKNTLADYWNVIK